MLGHGYSDKPPRNCLIEDYAQSTITFMDKLGLEKATLCGNSFGAFITLEIAATHPKRVDKWILVGCPAWDAWERMEELATTYAYPTPQLVEWVNQQRALAGIWIKKGLIAVSLYDFFAKMPLVKCPTLILVGSKDPSRERKRILAEGIKGAKHALMKDTSHVLQVEQPESFLQEVDKFLSS